MAFCLAELHLWSTKNSLRVKGSTYQHVQSPGDAPPLPPPSPPPPRPSPFLSSLTLSLHLLDTSPVSTLTICLSVNTLSFRSLFTTTSSPTLLSADQISVWLAVNCVWLCWTSFKLFFQHSFSNINIQAKVSTKLPVLFGKSLTCWGVFFCFPLCHLSVHLLFFERNALLPQFLVFSSLPFCLVFYSLLSSGQRYCLKETGVSVSLCVRVCFSVRTRCISKVMVTNPYLFGFFFLFTSPYVCVYWCVCVLVPCYLWKVCMDTSLRQAAEVWHSPITAFFTSHTSVPTTQRDLWNLHRCRSAAHVRLASNTFWSQRSNPSPALLGTKTYGMAAAETH